MIMTVKFTKLIPTVNEYQGRRSPANPISVDVYVYLDAIQTVEAVDSTTQSRFRHTLNVAQITLTGGNSFYVRLTPEQAVEWIDQHRRRCTCLPGDTT